MRNNRNLGHALFLLRISVFLVMFMWTIDKFIRPEHAASIFDKFYFLSGFGHTVMYVIGAVELIILLGFLLGVKKTFTYGFVLVAHSISTLSSFKQYFSPFEGAGLLFFAAWPMLAACYVLYRFRDEDVKYTASSSSE